VEALTRENAALRARVAELEAKLGENSTNSGKPPSSDAPGTRPGKAPSGKQRGGQPGHKPYKRVLLPPEKVTRRTRVAPKRCACCGGRRLAETDETRVHQVVEIPEAKPDVHEITMHGARCRDCGETSFASLPPGIPAHMFGPRLLALISYLLVSKMSRRQVQEVLVEVFGIPVSLGALSDSEQRASLAVAPAVDAAVAYARAQPVKHFDGSNWRLGGAMRGLWTIATSLVTVFFVTANSARDTIEPLLGTLSGLLVTDRGSQFGFWAMERRQVCWAHLVRKFVAFAERGDEGAELGRHLLLFSQVMLADWHRVRDGTLSRHAFQGRMTAVQTAIENLLARGVELRLRGLSGSCEDMLLHRGALFTFVREAGVEPTNNHAERALRPFVLWRKTSYGSQSERGCLFAARMMTVAQTLRQQRRPVFTFLVDACRAAQHRLPIPSLLPVMS